MPLIWKLGRKRAQAKLQGSSITIVRECSASMHERHTSSWAVAFTHIDLAHKPESCLWNCHKEVPITLLTGAGMLARLGRQASHQGRRSCSWRTPRTRPRLQAAQGSRAAAPPGHQCHPPSLPKSRAPRAASCAALWPSVKCSLTPLRRSCIIRYVAENEFVKLPVRYQCTTPMLALFRAPHMTANHCHDSVFLKTSYMDNNCMRQELQLQQN